MLAPSFEGASSRLGGKVKSSATCRCATAQNAVCGAVMSVSGTSQKFEVF
jgi:hypothetical protein